LIFCSLTSTTIQFAPFDVLFFIEKILVTLVSYLAIAFFSPVIVMETPLNGSLRNSSTGRFFLPVHVFVIMR